MKGFKKISSTNTHSVYSHPDGHFIKMSHKNLPKQAVGDLKRSLSHYSDGGVVKEKMLDREDEGMNGSIKLQEEPAPKNVVAAPKIQYPTPKVQGYAFGTDDVQTAPPGDGSMSDYERQQLDQMDANARLQPGVNFPEPGGMGMAVNPSMAGEGEFDQGPSLENVQAPSLQKSPEGGDPYGTETYYNTMQRGMEESKLGLGEELRGQEEMAKAQQQALTSSIRQEERNRNDYQTHFKALTQERNAFLQDMQNSHVDPDRYVNNMSGSKKIFTAIGLIMGGISQGLIGGENPALQFLQKNIDKDIEAQKAELGKKNNLLSANYHQFGNMHDAVQMTRVMSADILSSKLKMAAAQSTSPQARANALKAAGEIDMKMAPIMSELAARRAFLGNSNASNDPERAVRFIVPKERQKDVSHSIGKIKEVEAFRNELHKANETLNNMTMRGLFSPNQRKATVDYMADKLVHSTAGRFNLEAAKQQIDSVLVGKTDMSEETRNMKDRNVDGLMDVMRAEHDVGPHEFGIKIPKGGKSKANQKVAPKYRK